MYKQNTLSDKIVLSLIPVLHIVWILVALESLLWCIALPSKKQILESSPRYLPSPVSQHQLDFQNFNILSTPSNTTQSFREVFKKFNYGFQTNGDENISPTKPSVWFFGGSHVYDPNNPTGKDWVLSIDPLLKSNLKVRLVNAGVPGWRTFDIIGSLAGKVHYFNPTVIVICQTYNDLKYLGWANINNPPMHILPALGHPSHQYENSFSNQFPSQIYLRYKALKKTLIKSKVKTSSDMDVISSQINNGSILPSALKQYHFNLQTIVHEITSMGAIPILCTEPRLITTKAIHYMKSKKMDNSSTGLSLDTLITAYSKADSIIQHVASTNKVLFVDLSKQCSGDSTQFSDIIHYAKGGGACASNILANVLDSILNLKNKL